MGKYHIPNDLVLQDGEDELHEKVGKDSKFCKYYHEMERLIDEAVTDDTLKKRISEAFRMVYIFAEIAAYREGFKEGIRFLINVLNNADESIKSSK